MNILHTKIEGVKYNVCTIKTNGVTCNKKYKDTGSTTRMNEHLKDA